MRHLPKSAYCGLTIIVDKPSRFDSVMLLSGWAGSQFMDWLRPVSRLQVDLRTLETLDLGFVPGTKVILALGPLSASRLAGPEAPLSAIRGSPCLYQGIPVIFSFLPVDAFHNIEHSEDYKSADEKSTKGSTPHNQWPFWLKWDTKKAVRLLKDGLCVKTGIHHFYPPLYDMIKMLRERKGECLYLDIETTYHDYRLTCIGFSFKWPDIYVVPFQRYHGGAAYDDLALFLAALAIAMRDNETVIHNCFFDLIVLFMYYGVPYGGRIYDTMIAHNRIFPDVAKSLGHCISLYLDNPFHKNEGVVKPENGEQETQLWSYNAKDVESLILLKSAIDETAEVIKGCPESIKAVMAMIPHYLLMSMWGAKVDKGAREALMVKHDKRRNQMLRILRLLVGRDINPGSPKQLGELLFEQLGLKPFSYTAKGAPSTGAEDLYALALKHPEIALFPVILDYRKSAKLQGTLKEELFYDNE